MSYFSYFNKIKYGNNQAINLTERARLLRSISDNPYIFYPYTLEEDERADNTSFNVFNDPFLNWVIYVSNDIIDPYYDWYMDSASFNEFIIKKYGSEQIAQETILGYRNNWYKNTGVRLSQQQFNQLTFKEKRYWDVDDNLIYTRRKMDEVLSTNLILKLELSVDDISSLGSILDQKVVLKYNDTDITGEVCYIGSTYILVQHVSNFGIDFNHNNITEVNSFNIEGVSVYHQNIDPVISKYFEPFTAYDKEIEKNEFNHSIKILDPKVVPKFITNLKVTMQNGL